MVIKSLELQRIIVNSVKNIDYLKTHNVNIFTSVPLSGKAPYIKIVNISFDRQRDTNIDSFVIDLFVVSDGKNNSKILEIMECLFDELEEKINQQTESRNTNIKIFDIYDMKYNVSEDLQGNF